MVIAGLDLVVFFMIGWFIANLIVSIGLEVGINVMVNIYGHTKNMKRTMQILSIIGFFGVSVHEFGHYLMCKVWKLEVVKVDWLTWNEGFEGAVITKIHGNAVAQIFVTIGPIITTTIISAVLWTYYHFLGNTAVDACLKFFICILLLSLIIGQLPSRQDWNSLGKVFSVNPKAASLSLITSTGSIIAFLFLIPLINYFSATISCFVASMLFLIIIARVCPPTRGINSLNKKRPNQVTKATNNLQDFLVAGMIEGTDQRDDEDYLSLD